MSREPTPEDGGLWWLLPALVKLGVSALVLSAGFHAVSDDDFARVVIAQRFAAQPAWDPSQTSWLPAPFWLLGAAMRLLGDAWWVARGASMAVGGVAAALLWKVARWQGLGPRGAAVAATAAACFPYAAWLGAATIPDFPTAALLLVATVGTSTGGRTRRWGGAAALAWACASRYEAWPVAGACAVFLAADACRRAARPGPWRLARGELFALSAAALSVPVVWLAHGAWNHGDPLFFVRRVTEYRHALGGASPALASSLWQTALSLTRLEPELTILGLFLAWSGARLGMPLAHWRRPALALGMMALSLAVSASGDGAPTHHAERALVSVWMLLALLSVDVLLWLARRMTLPARVGLALGLALACSPLVLVDRGQVTGRGRFVDRAGALRAGRMARDLLGRRERVLVLAPDYSYFAVMAGLGAPERARSQWSHDPRAEASEACAADWPAQLRGVPERWFILPRSDAVQLGSGYRQRGSESGWALVERLSGH